MHSIAFNNIDIKQINKNKVYNFIYNEKQTCKSIITQSTNIGLSTVNQNLKILEQENLIHKNGFFESTGGRKADAIEIIPNARISIGIAILKDTIFIVATNLYGEVIKDTKIDFTFEQSKNYYLSLCDKLDEFVISNKLTNILGVSITTQGIVSYDGDFVTHGQILDNMQMKLTNFIKHIPYPCRLEHDSKAAAILELWQNKHVTDGVVFLLNYNLGGAIITNSTVQNGISMKSGLVEHLTLDYTGEDCYCGSKGCLETYCSGQSLEKISNMSIINFFNQVLLGDEECINIWRNYLKNLAKAIRNICVIVDGYYILSGLIADFIRPNDVEFLVENINSCIPFEFDRDKIIIGHSGEYTQAIGTSLFYIKEFLCNV